MRHHAYESNSKKKILTYCFYVVLVGWFFATLVLAYQFLLKNSQKTSKKWGTFVEAIFNQVSYLPYLKNDWQSLFYQSFLFDACINYHTLNTEGLKWENCKITTQDYQTYYVSLPQEPKKERSDGVYRTIDDLLFTYDTVIKQNLWDLKTLNIYKDIAISQEGERVKIVFPTSTTDNNFFFTSYILPKHVLEHSTLDTYIKIFASNPITSACGKIAPKTKDENSLVFDLTKCEDTNLGFYQIKNYELFEHFSKAVLEEKNTLIDTYAHQLTLDGYEKMNIIKSQLLTLFFNTKSDKVKVRLRRALGGLINAKFYDGAYGMYLKKYQEPLLNLFFSDGSNIKEFINRLNDQEENETVSAEDLHDSGVKPLKNSIQINGVERKFVFYTQKPESKVFNLEIKFSNQFESIKVKDGYKNTFTPTKYKKTDKKIVYPLELGKNLRDGLNQYTIEGTIKGKTYVIANIDLYLLTSQAPIKTTQDENEKTKLKIVYYNNLESNFAIKQLRAVFEQAGILESFLFEQVSSPEELEGKLVLGDYDILLNTINIGLKKDILKILITEDPLVNPSRYSNPQLNTLFKQYTKNPNSSALTENINQLFAQDLPFVVLGYPYDFVNIKSNLLGTGQTLTGELYEYNWRNFLYNKVVLVQNTVIDFSSLKNPSKFITELSQILLPNVSLFAPDSASEVGRIEEKTDSASQASWTQEEFKTPEQTPAPEVSVSPDPNDPFADLIKPAE